MAFENFPYTDFHALNLDWILKEVKRAIKAADDLEAVKKWVESYFDDVEVRTAVEQVLDEWKQDGTLRTALNTPFKEACGGWLGFNKGWNVAKNGTVVTLSRTEVITVESLTKVSNSDYWYSERFTFPTDYPVDRASVQIMTNNFLLNGHATNYDSTHVSVVLGTGIDYTDSLPLTVGVEIMVQCRRPVPPTNPRMGVVSGSNGNAGALRCAKSFLEAREAGREFAYGTNFMYTTSDKVNNGRGAGLVECDNIAMMALLGIDYSHSPYVNTQADATYDFDNLVVNPQGLYPWTDNTRQLVKQVDGSWVNGLDQRITNASSISWWMWNNGYVFTDASQAQSGDLVMFRRMPTIRDTDHDRGSFDNVTHVGVIERVGSEIYVIHATIEQWTEGKVIVETKLEDFYNLAPGRYSPENTMFARINFA